MGGRIQEGGADSCLLLAVIPSRDQREAISSSSVARAIKARGQTTLTRQCSMPLEQSLTSISTRQDNRDAIGGYCNVSSPPYSAPMSSAIAASWGRTKRRPSALCPQIAS